MKVLPIASLTSFICILLTNADPYPGAACEVFSNMASTAIMTKKILVTFIVKIQIAAFLLLLEKAHRVNDF